MTKRKPKRKRTDKERLDFVQREEVWLSRQPLYWSAECNVNDCDIEGKGSSVRQAIDRAMDQAEATRG